MARMTKKTIRLAQRYLNEGGYKAGKEDGVFGPGTEAAIDRGLKAAGDRAPKGWQKWPKTRKLVGGIQVVAKANGIDPGKIDGYWGPVTDFAYTSLLHHLKYDQMPAPWRDREPSTANPNGWPTEKGLNSFYGRVGTNQVMLTLPYKHRLAWDLTKKVTRTSCNKKVAESLERVLTKVRDHYGEDGIRDLRLDHFGGCLNVRKKRGGTSYSTHSWGVALDYDPSRNGLHVGRDKATFALPDYEKWWEFWEAEGWLSLGRAKNYDWMHVQAVRL